MPTYRGEAYWPVLYGVKFHIEAATPEEAMAKLKQAEADDVDPEIGGCFYETAESLDDSDGPTTLAIWDEAMREELLRYPSEDERMKDAAPGLIEALKRVLELSPVCQARCGHCRICVAHAAIDKARGVA